MAWLGGASQGAGLGGGPPYAFCSVFKAGSCSLFPSYAVNIVF